MSNNQIEELPFVSVHYNTPYHWSTGQYMGRFYQELRDTGIIYANQCSECSYCLVPPRILCPRCHIRMGKWIEMGPKGRLLAYGVVEEAFWDPHEGKMREVPYTHAYFQLDGPPAGAFSHMLEETDPKKIKIGMRVEAVFKPPEERIGHLRDILHFRTIEDDE